MQYASLTLGWMDASDNYNI